MLLNCGAGEDSWEALGLQGDPTSPFWRRSALNIHWKGWCWNKFQYIGHLLRSWLIGKDPDGGKDWRQEERGWQRVRWLDGITDSCTWVWASSGRWWGEPGLLQFVGSQSQTPLSDWATATSGLIILNQCFPKTYYRFKSLLIPLKCSFKLSFLSISPLPFVLVPS